MVKGKIMTSNSSKKPTPKPTPSPVSELLPIGGALSKLFGGLNTILGLFRKK
jgi:hypothetical protein